MLGPRGRHFPVLKNMTIVPDTRMWKGTVANETKYNFGADEMKRTKIVRLVSVVLGVAGLFCGVRLLAVAKAPRFELVGPPETALLEKTLRARLGVYAWGIWPRDEKFDGAVPGQNLPKKYVERLKTWLPRILKKDLLPETIDPNQWRGIRKLDGWSDFVIGQHEKADPNAKVEFRADGLLLGITAVSEDYFPNGVAGVTDDQIIKGITGLLNYPKDKVQSITLEKHFEQMGEADNKVMVCYGKLRDKEYDETKPPLPDGRNMPTWWNCMPFWMTKGKVFVSASMVNWESFPASLDPYVFKF